MALILKEIFKLYHFLNDDLADQRIQHWPLMRSPWAGLTLLGIYLAIVFKWGPRYMKYRRAYDLWTVIALYNFVQILACGYIVYQALRLGWGAHYKIFCQPCDHSDNPQAIEYAWKVCYAYFVTKIVDLLDTIFFVLRKKQSQVTFLHVYHHFGMVILSWCIVKWLPGGHGTMMILVNSVVHMVMYAYYLLTVWDPTLKQSAWWKKHVTQLQLVQFTWLFIHFCSLVVKKDCAYPKLPALILIPQNLFLAVLFGDFYYRAYIRKSKNE